MSSATPSKRTVDESVVEASDNGKRQKFSEETEKESSVGGVTVRVLCPASKIDAFVGESDGTIARIMEDSGALVLVQETVPDCDVRVIVITVSDTDDELASELSKDDGVEAEAGDGDAKGVDGDTKDDGDAKGVDGDTKDDGDAKGVDGETKDEEDGGENEDPAEDAKNDDGENKDDVGESTGGGGQTEDNDGEAKEGNGCGNAEDNGICEDGESLRVKSLRYERTASCLQRALFLIFDKLVELESEKETEDGAGDEDVDESSLVLKFLVDSSQVLCLYKNDGLAIQEMSTISGAQIQILPRDDLPSCALPSDEVVQIAGKAEVVRRGLELVSRQIIENSFPFLDTSVKSSRPSSQSTSQSHPISHAISSSFRSSNARNSSRNGSRSDRNGHSKDILMTGPANPPLAMLSFRILCNGDRVGSVIGKGGTGIKSIKLETGSEITIMDGVPDSEEQIIVVSGPAHPDDRISPVQHALVRVLKRILGAFPNSKDGGALARMLVSSNQIGCLLGVGGAVIAEMRKSSRAYIRIVGKDQVPKCAMQNEEVVQINGNNNEVHDALLQITSRLRHHYFRNAFSPADHPKNPHFSDPVPPFPLYSGRRDMSPPGIYPTFGPSAHKFDGSHGAVQHLDDGPFMQNTFRPSLSRHIPEGGPWNQGPIDSGGFMDIPHFARGLPGRLPGFGGNQPAIITNTTVEVVVPRSVVPAIKGEGGGCLKQIRQFSNARITIRESKPGEKDTAIIISGTPEQTQAAQSLIQAFVMIEQESN